MNCDYLKLYSIRDDDVLKFIKSWQYQDDIYDTFEKINGIIRNEIQPNNYLKNIELNYIFINELLLHFFYNKKIKLTNSFIQEYISYVIQNKSIINIQEFILKTFYIFSILIYELYNKFTTRFITFEKYLEDTGQIENIDNIVLYRGFDSDRYNLLLNKSKKVEINKKFKIGCFLSTTLYRTTALSYIRSHNIENRILWKINISSDKFNDFYYSYLLSSNHCFESEHITPKNDVEFLLNLNIELQLKNIKK